jgi:hypothetical protein
MFNFEGTTTQLTTIYATDKFTTDKVTSSWSEYGIFSGATSLV